jgi:hypothetical protein
MKGVGGLNRAGATPVSSDQMGVTREGIGYVDSLCGIFRPEL